MEPTETPMLVIGIGTVLPECTPTDVVAGYPAPARPFPDRNPIVVVLWGRDDSQHSRSSLGSFACAEPPVYPPDLAKRNRNHPTAGRRRTRRAPGDCQCQKNDRSRLIELPYSLKTEVRIFELWPERLHADPAKDGHNLMSKPIAFRSAATSPVSSDRK